MNAPRFFDLQNLLRWAVRSNDAFSKPSRGKKSGTKAQRHQPKPGFRKAHKLHPVAGATVRQISKRKFLVTYADPTRDRVYDYKRRIQYLRGFKNMWDRI